MTCTKFENLDQENPNYQSLVDAIKNKKVELFENQSVAVIRHHPLEIKFGTGMKSYLESQGFIVSAIR